MQVSLVDNEQVSRVLGISICLKRYMLEGLSDWYRGCRNIFAESDKRQEKTSLIRKSWHFEYKRRQNNKISTSYINI